MSKRKKVSAASASDVEDDSEAIQSHIKELEKELKRNNYNEVKVSRLMSLTFTTQRSAMLSQRANVRIMPTLQKYPCLKKPIFVSSQIELTSSYCVCLFCVVIDNRIENKLEMPHSN